MAFSHSPASLQNEEITPVAADYRSAASIKATAAKRGSIVELSDCLIATIAVRLSLPVITGNTGDFKAIQGAGIDLKIIAASKRTLYSFHVRTPARSTHTTSVLPCGRVIPNPRREPNLAFLFDMDGVIVDSNPLHAVAWRIYLEQRGVSADGIEERMHGKRNDELVRAWFGPGLSEEEVIAHGANKEALYREMMRPQMEARLVPGVQQFLARHAGRPMGLVSNAEPANVDFVLEGAGLRPYFRVVVDGHQVERPKPYPDIYLRAAGLLGAEPPGCVVFEDSRTGIEAALAAGARVVAVKTTSAPLPAVECEVADFTDPALESWLQHIESRA